MNFERYDSMTVEELRSEKRILFGAMQNEKIWMHGAKTMEEEIMHCNNLHSIIREINYVMKKIDELEGNL